MKIYVLETMVDGDLEIHLYQDRANAFTHMQELVEYATGGADDGDDPGGDVRVDFEGEGFIQLYEQETED